MDGRMPRHDTGPMPDDTRENTSKDAAGGGRLLLLRAKLPLPHIAGPSPFGAMDEAGTRRHASLEAQNERRVARTLLLHGLRLLGIDEEDLCIQSGKHGKPFLSGARFSFSYADAPCCLVSREAATLGLDCLRLRKDFLPAPSFFKDGWRLEKAMNIVAREEERLHPSGETQADCVAVLRLKTTGTLRRLTMVEAIGKAQGTGLAYVQGVELGEGFRRMGVCTLEGEKFAWRTLAFAGTYMTMAIDEAHAHLLRRVEVVTLHRNDLA